MSFQNITIMGNVGKDPEVRFTSGGKAVCNFSVAVNEGSKEKQHTTWFKVVAWDKVAEICGSSLKKGSQCLINGRMQTNEFTTKDGSKSTSMELVIGTIKFIGPYTKSEPAKPAAKSDYSYGPPSLRDDDVPF